MKHRFDQVRQASSHWFFGAFWARCKFLLEMGLMIYYWCGTVHKSHDFFHKSILQTQNTQAKKQQQQQQRQQQQQGSISVRFPVS